jgi:hypothetical protein
MEAHGGRRDDRFGAIANSENWNVTDSQIQCVLQTPTRIRTDDDGTGEVRLQPRG